MVKKLDVLVDMDSIIVNFMDGLLDAYASAGGEAVYTDDIKGWDMGRYVQDPTLLFDCMYRKGFFRNLKPLPGALDALMELQSLGHNIVIVTSPCTPHSASEKIEWLDEHCPFLGTKDYFIGHHKWMVRGDVLIDDGLHNARGYRERHPDALIATIAYPYNEDPDGLYDVRVDGFEDPARAWSWIKGAVVSFAAGQRPALRD